VVAACTRRYVRFSRLDVVSVEAVTAVWTLVRALRTWTEAIAVRATFSTKSQGYIMKTAPFVRHVEESTWMQWDDPRDGALSFTSTIGDGSTPSNDMTAGQAKVPVGGWLGLHSHEATEIYHVLAGEGMVLLAGEEQPVRAGSFVFIPSGCVHGIRNTGARELEFFYVYAADSATDERTLYFYPDSESEKDGN
jgi:mannose-6-phosphate isomerase-like protein (cupin superfamily)